MNQSSMKPYWASVDAKEIADNILDKVDDYYKYLSMSGRLDLMRRSWSYYYRPRITGGMLTPVGQQGELTALSVNHFRNLLVHLETLTTQQKASFEVHATNTDTKSQAQVILAGGLLDYYEREKGLGRNFKQSVKDGLIFSESFLRAEWDATSGDTYGKTPSGATVYQGDVKYTNYTPLNVIRDYTLESPQLEHWYILRSFKNKHDLAAKYPDIAEKILEDSIDGIEIYRTTLVTVMGLEESDNIPVYTLLHDPTPALPQGRYTEVLGNGTVLLDGPLPYDQTHVYRLAPDEETGTIFGYTVAFDLLPVQESIDLLYSSAISNNATFGVQNILVPKGHDLSTSQMSGGLNVMEYDPKVGKPEALNLLETPAELYNFITTLQNVQQMLAGVDSVTRGDPSANLKSGSALALVAAQSIQFSMNLQESYARLVGDTGSGTIYLLQDFAAVPRVAEISGISNRPLMREFTGQDIGAIRRVTAELGNPIMRTTSGKQNLADVYMDRGMIENPDQYIQVITTGRLEPIIEGKQAQLLLIKGENEKLSEGQPQRALITDNHAKHILEHTTVLSNPEIRQDPNNPIVQVTLDHISEHMMMMNNPANLQLMQVLHQEIVPPMAPPPMQGAPAQLGPAGSAAPPVVQTAEEVNMPNMPSAPTGTPPETAEVIQGMQAS